MLKTRRWLIVTGVFTLLVLGAFFWWKSRQGLQEWKVETVKTQNLKDIVEVSGMVYSDYDVTLKSSSQGEVKARFIQENQKVKLGHPLLKVDNTNLSLQLKQANTNWKSNERQAQNDLGGAKKSLVESQKRKQKELEQLKNQVLKSKKTVDFLKKEQHRQNQLLKNQVISQKEFDKQLETFTQAQLDLKSLQDQYKLSQLEHSDIISTHNRIRLAQVNLTNARQQGQVNSAIAKNQLSKSVIYAPFAGSISQWKINIGDYVTPGTALARFQDLEHIYLKININELDYPKIKINNPVSILFDAYPDQPFQGKVIWMSQASSASSDNLQVFPVKIRFKNPQNKIKPGMSGDAKVTVEERKNIIAIPIGSVSKKEKAFWVSILNSEQKREEVKVTPGLNTLDNIEIKSGLKVGDQLILNPPEN